MEPQETTSSLSEGLSVVAKLAVKHGLVAGAEIETLLSTGMKNSTSLGQALISRGHMKPRQLEILYEIAACEMVGDTEGAAEAVTRLKEARGAASSAPTAVDPEVANAQSDPKRRFGKYALLNEIGRGAMGIVYRAWQADLRRIVALKILPSEMADAEERARFDREARTAASLHHSNIVRIHETGEIDGRQYYTMDFIDGSPLSVHIKKSGPMPLEQALDLMAQASMAVHFAHDHGVVHRDIKPANILVDKEGRPFICDFGLAKSAHDQSMTMTGMVMGTPFYMSPEQAEGRTRDILARSDVYSLGAVLYQTVTGTLPFSGDDFGKLFDQIRSVKPEAPSARVKTLPRDLDAVILQAMEKDPQKRYPTAMHFAAELRRILKGVPTEAKVQPITGRASVKSKTTGRIPKVHLKKSNPAPMIAVVSIAAVAIIGVLLLRNPGDSGAEKALKAEVERLQAKIAKTTNAEERAALQLEIDSKLDPKGPAHPVAPKSGPAVEPSKPPPPVKDWGLLEDRVNQLSADRAFGEALKRLSTYLPSSDEGKKFAEEKRKWVLSTAATAYDAVERDAKRLKEDAKYGDVLKKYQEALAFGIDEYTAKAGEQIRLIEEAFKSIDVEGQLPKLGPLRGKVAATCAQRKYVQAQADIAAARTDLPALGTHLDALAALVGEGKSALDHVPLGAMALKGKSMEMMLNGKIRKVELRGSRDGKAVVFPLDTRTETVVELPELRTADVVALAMAGGASPEALGLFQLFEGRPDLARQAWKLSPRRESLDLFAEQVGVKASETEARAALDAIVEAQKRKDWKKCRELLALHQDRFAATDAWKAAAAQIDEIAFGSAEESDETTHAVKPRRATAGLEWRYDFTQPAHTRDWSLYGTGDSPGSAGQGMRSDKEGLYLRNGEARFVSPLEAEGSCSADLVILERGLNVFGLQVAGFRLFVRDRGSLRISSPSGKELFNQKASDLPVNKPFRVRLLVTRQAVTAFIDDREAGRADHVDSLQRVQPSVFTQQDTALRILRGAVVGTMRTGWPEEQKTRQATLSKVGRSFPMMKPDVLTDGKSLGKFRKEEGGTWEVVDGAVRGVSPEPQLKTELHTEGFRNFRLKMKFAFHSGRFAQLGVRMGPGKLFYHLPADQPEKWRDLEIVVAETAVSATVDGGVVSILPEEWPIEVSDGGIRLQLQGTALSIKDVILEEIRNIPPEAIFRKSESPAIAMSGTYFSLVDGKWSKAAHLIEGTQIRAEGKPRLEHAGAQLTLENGTRFMLIKDRLILLEGTATVEIHIVASSKFGLELDGEVLRPEGKLGRLVMIAKPDRVFLEEGHAMRDRQMLAEGSEYLVKKGAEAEVQKKRSLPPAQRHKETLTWALDLNSAATKKALALGSVVDIPGGGRALKSVATKTNTYYSGCVEYAYEPPIYTVKKNTAVRFRYFMKDPVFFQLKVYNATHNKNFRFDVDAVANQWTTITVFLMDVTEEAGGKGLKTSLDDKYGGFMWHIGYQGKQGYDVLIDNVQIVEIER